jgi:fumarate reductase flavoprotein subunit
VTYDVIVVGAGWAGHCAAIAALESGARTLLLEKTELYGGSSAMCGGSFAFAGTDIQLENGIKDSEDALLADLTETGGGLSKADILQAYVDKQLSTYYWLKDLGMRFDRVAISSNQSVPRNHSTDPVQALNLLHDKALSSPRFRYLPNCGAKELITDADGAVVGLRTDSGEDIRAAGGVVLATGGFSRSEDLIARFAPFARSAKKMGGFGNTGDGLKMAWALGADMLDMGNVSPTFGAALVQPDADMQDPPPRILQIMYKGAIVVNKIGKRFVNESVSYKKIGRECMSQPEQAGFQIFDRQVMSQSAPLPRNVNYKRALEAGLIYEAETIRDLALKLGVDADNLVNTVEAYNQACDNKTVDEFGRVSLSSGFGRPTKIDQGPYYGYPCVPGLTSTFCGLATDAQARVLTVFGKTVPGLYAIGELMGGLHGENYMSGSSLGKGCIFGKLAGEDAANRAGCIAEVAS